MSKVEEPYENFYVCPNDGTEWYENADSMCNDRCPNCNKEIEPTSSEFLGDSEEIRVELGTKQENGE